MYKTDRELQALVDTFFKTIWCKDIILIKEQDYTNFSIIIILYDPDTSSLYVLTALKERITTKINRLNGILERATEKLGTESPVLHVLHNKDTFLENLAESLLKGWRVIGVPK